MNKNLIKILGLVLSFAGMAVASWSDELFMKEEIREQVKKELADEEETEEGES